MKINIFYLNIHTCRRNICFVAYLVHGRSDVGEVAEGLLDEVVQDAVARDNVVLLQVHLVIPKTEH